MGGEREALIALDIPDFNGTGLIENGCRRTVNNSGSIGGDGQIVQGRFGVGQLTAMGSHLHIRQLAARCVWSLSHHRNQMAQFVVDLGRVPDRVRDFLPQ